MIFLEVHPSKIIFQIMLYWTKWKYFGAVLNRKIQKLEGFKID